MKVKFGMMVLGIAVAGAVHAAGQPVPNTFQAGQRAVASQVNENFQNLADRIAAGGEVEAASIYKGNGITTKTYQVTDVSSGCTTFETHSFASSNGGATLTQTIVGTAGNGGSFCFKRIHTHQINTTGSFVTQINNYDASDFLTSTSAYTPGIEYLPAQVHVGLSWAIDTDRVSTPTGGSAVNGTQIGEYTIVSKENVTVPAGTYSNCLKITRYSYSAQTGSTNNPSARIDWRCPGVGLVKRRESTGRTLVLNSVS